MAILMLLDGVGYVPQNMGLIISVLTIVSTIAMAYGRLSEKIKHLSEKVDNSETEIRNLVGRYEVITEIRVVQQQTAAQTQEFREEMKKLSHDHGKLREAIASGRRPLDDSTPPKTRPK